MGTPLTVLALSLMLAACGQGPSGSTPREPGSGVAGGQFVLAPVLNGAPPPPASRALLAESGGRGDNQITIPSSVQRFPTITPEPTVPAPPSVTPTPFPTPTLVAETKPTPTPTLLPTLTPIFAPTPTPTPTPRPERTVAVALITDLETVSVGRQFQLQVQVKAGITNRVDTVQVYLEFDPSYLEVGFLTDGGNLEIPLQLNLDNSRGRIDFSVGTLGDSAWMPFTLATVYFRALAPTGPQGTYIAFADLLPPRQTKTIEAGANITGDLSSANVVVVR